MIFCLALLSIFAAYKESRNVLVVDLENTTPSYFQVIDGKETNLEEVPKFSFLVKFGDSKITILSNSSSLDEKQRFLISYRESYRSLSKSIWGEPLKAYVMYSSFFTFLFGKALLVFSLILLALIFWRLGKTINSYDWKKDPTDVGGDGGGGW